MKIPLTYLNHCIEITLPDPTEDNTIFVTISRSSGTYDENLYNAYLTDYLFCAENADPNRWLAEAVESAIATLADRGIYYYLEATTTATTSAAKANADDCCSDDIPF